MKVSEIRLVYNSKVKTEDRPQIRSSQDAYWVLESNWSDQVGLVEEFNILLLDRSNRVMKRWLNDVQGKAFRQRVYALLVRLR